MHAQLQDGVDAAAGFALDLLQGIEIPRIDDQGVLADRIGADTEREPDVRIVEMIRRTDGDVVNPLFRLTTPQLLEMAIESFNLVEEPHVEREPIEDADSVMRVGGSDQTIAGVLDRLQMTRRDVPADAGN